MAGGSASPSAFRRLGDPGWREIESWSREVVASHGERESQPGGATYEEREPEAERRARRAIPVRPRLRHRVDRLGGGFGDRPAGGRRAGERPVHPSFICSGGRAELAPDPG